MDTFEQTRNVEQTRNRLLPLCVAAVPTLNEHTDEVALRAGQNLHRAGHPIEFVYFPHDALVSLVVSGSSEIEVGMVGAEGAIGGMAGLGLVDATQTAMVRFPGSATRIPSAELLAAASKSELMRGELVRHEAALTGQAQVTAFCNTFHSVENRLCRWLLGAHQRSGRTDLPITQTILAQMLGVQRTTVTLELGKLQETRALACRRGHIHLLDLDQVARHACDCEDQAARRSPRPSATPYRLAVTPTGAAAAL
ncbi:MAG TPA: Crp/Fnr family transcriptional regulator [Xanthobacteraceae bacterium]